MEVGASDQDDEKCYPLKSLARSFYVHKHFPSKPPQQTTRHVVIG